MSAPAAPDYPALRCLRRRAVAAGIVLFGLVVGAAAATRSYDDAWITYRYAYNFAAGEGLVYNAGERLLGTSAPGTPFCWVCWRCRRRNSCRSSAA